jgi:hypothetical protein
MRSSNRGRHLHAEPAVETNAPVGALKSSARPLTTACCTRHRLAARRNLVRESCVVERRTSLLKGFAAPAERLHCIPPQNGVRVSVFKTFSQVNTRAPFIERGVICMTRCRPIGGDTVDCVHCCIIARNCLGNNIIAAVVKSHG